MWGAIQAADRLVRVHLLFFTALWPLLGVASVATDISPGKLGALLGSVICFHVYAYVLNDVIDLPIDRTQPARQRDPLVLGQVRPRQGLLLALVQPLVTVPLTLWLGGAALAQATLFAGFALMGAYNLWGKRCPCPPVTDAIQGLAWGSLAIYAPLALGIAPNALTWTTAMYATVFTMFINGIHGSLRDLANDLGSGARTTAILLGARPVGDAGTAHVPAPMAAYAWGILVVLVALNATILLRNDFHYGPLGWTITAAVVGAFNAWAVLLQPDVLRPRRFADSAWRLQMYVMLLSLPIAFVGHASVAICAVFVLLNGLALALWESTPAVARSAAVNIRSLLVPARARQMASTMTISSRSRSDSATR
jgi:4-hydroxybenzoate polyprenyltransferase